MIISFTRILTAAFTTVMMCALTSPSVVCQEEISEAAPAAAYEIGADFGMIDAHIKDTYLSPYIYHGSMAAERISFHAATQRMRHWVDAWFSRGGIDSDTQPRDVTQTMGGLSYAWLHSIYSGTVSARKFEAFVGAGISTTISNTDFWAVDRVNNYSVMDRSWYWAYAFDIQAAAEYCPAERTTVSIRCTAPLVQNVSRPANGHYFEARNADIALNFWKAAYGGSPDYLWKHLAIGGSAQIAQQLSGSLGLRVSYAFDYVSNGRPLWNAWFINTFQAGVFLNF